MCICCAKAKYRTQLQGVVRTKLIITFLGIMQYRHMDMCTQIMLKTSVAFM